MDVSREQAALRQFALHRDWEQFHTPKNLAMALSGEAGELLSIFQWLTAEQSSSVMSTAEAEHIRDELADVLIYTLRLADVLDVDLTAAVEVKIEKNQARYPVESSRGSANKH